jgi:proteasome lid subunit RPN8/RPN11
MNAGEDDFATLGAARSPFTIEYSRRVLDDIRLAVTDAFYSLPHGGAEIGGVLLGKHQDGCVRIVDYAPLECEHALGPSFTLSPADRTRLAEMIAAARKGSGGRRPVGWYHSHTRSEIFLSDADIDIHKRYFPEPWQVALVLKPRTFDPTRGAFFFREEDGRIDGTAAACEFTLAPLAAAPVPAAIVAAGGTAGEPCGGAAACPALAREEAGSLGVEPAPVPAGAEERRNRPAFRWIPALVAALALLAAGLATSAQWLPYIKTALGVRPPRIGLNALDHDGQLQIRWDAGSAAVERAFEGDLRIVDGGGAPQAIAVDRPHLRAGSLTYARRSGRVDATMTLRLANGERVREAATFFGDPPGPKAAEGAPPAADRLARETEQLRRDLNAANERNRALEKALGEARRQLGQEQQRRLRSQSPESVK